MGRKKQQRPTWLDNSFIPWEALAPEQQKKAKWHLGIFNPKRHIYQLDEEGYIRRIHHMEGDAGKLVQFKPKRYAWMKTWWNGSKARAISV